MPLYDLRTGKLIGMPPSGGSMTFTFDKGSTTVTTDMPPWYSNDEDMEAAFASALKQRSEDFKKNTTTPTPAELKKTEKNRKKKMTKAAKKLREKAEELEKLMNLKISEAANSEDSKAVEK